MENEYLTMDEYEKFANEEFVKLFEYVDQTYNKIYKLGYESAQSEGISADDAETSVTLILSCILTFLAKGSIAEKEVAGLMN